MAVDSTPGPNEAPASDDASAWVTSWQGSRAVATAAMLPATVADGGGDAAGGVEATAELGAATVDAAADDVDAAVVAVEVVPIVVSVAVLDDELHAPAPRAKPTTLNVTTMRRMSYPPRVGWQKVKEMRCERASVATTYRGAASDSGRGMFRRMAGRWPFVGRVRELAHVEALLAAGVGALVVGEPGVGKSAFAREVGRRAEAAGATVGQVAGHAVSSGTPFETFAGALSDSRDPTELDVADVVARLFATIAAPPGKPPLLVVDDVALIDERSAQVLLRIAAANTAIIVATAPESTPLPPAIDRLWRDGLCERIDLTPLSDDEVAAFVEAVLDGPVDAATARTFADRSGGNPLFLRELLTATLNESLLVRRDVGGDHSWALVAQPPVSRGIRETVATRLAGLPEAQRSALELIAAGEPLAAAVAADLVGENVLDELATERLLVVRDGLGGPTISTAHPVYGEVLRADVSVLRLHRLRLLLARRLETGARPLPHDLVRAAVWRLDSGQAGDAERLVDAARAARSISLATAERLARHAYETSGSLPAALLLAEVLTHSGRTDAAAELTARLPPESLHPADREAIVYCAAIGQGLLSGDPGAGADLVAGVLAGDPAASDQLHALHAALLAFDARFEAALE
ncbi:MAG: AAA family ATPase, partial [Acidothermaceae bacterium]